MTMLKTWVDQLRANGVTVSKKQAEYIDWLHSFPEVRDWVTSLESNRKYQTTTLKLYALSLWRFCKCIGMNPTQLIRWALEGQSIAYADPTKNVERARVRDALRDKAPLMKRYRRVSGAGNQQAESDEPITPSSLLGVQVAVVSFMTHEMLGFDFEWVDVTPDVKTPTMEDILAMEKACLTLRDRCMLWFFVNTGARPSSILKLKWGVPTPNGSAIYSTKGILPYNDKVPMCIIISAKDNKGKGIAGYKPTNQTTFLTDYTWKIFEEYRKSVNGQPDDKIFGDVHYYTFENQRVDILKRAFGKAAKGEKRFTWNSFRHYIQESARNSSVQEMDINAFVGHVLVAGMGKKYIASQLPKITEASTHHLRDEYVKVLQYLTPH